MTLFIGIDPGLRGGYAMIEQIGVETHIAAKPLPTVIATKTKRKYDHVGISAIFSNLGDLNCYAVLEEQQPRPVYYKDKQGKEKKQGATSLYTIGCCFCMLKQALVDFKIPHEIILPKNWQREFGITGKKGNTKTQSIEICKRLFPNLSLLPTPKSRKDSDGLADAALICEWGRRHYNGELISK